jgi:hypothetical protein
MARGVTLKKRIAIHYPSLLKSTVRKCERQRGND